MLKNMLKKPKSTDYPYDYTVDFFLPDPGDELRAAKLAESKSLVERRYGEVVFDDDFDCDPPFFHMRAWQTDGMTPWCVDHREFIGTVPPCALIGRDHTAYAKAVFQWKRAVLAEAGQLDAFADEIPKPTLDTWLDCNLREPMTNDFRADLDYCEEEYNITWDHRVDLELKRNRHVRSWGHNDPPLFSSIIENPWEKLKIYPDYQVGLSHGTMLLLQVMPQSEDTNKLIAEWVEDYSKAGNPGHWASDVIYDVGELPRILEQHNRRFRD